MSVREELEAFQSQYDGVDHLVFADIGTGMVLLGVSMSDRPQEEHDALAARAEQVLLGNAQQLAKLSGEHDGQFWVYSSDGPAIFVRSPASDEVLAMRLSRTADPAEIAKGAMEVLDLIVEEGA